MPVGLPLSPLPCALYLLSVIQRLGSFSPVKSAFSSIRHFHVIVGLPTPTDNTLVINLLEAAKRKLVKPVKKKEPITVEVLERMFDCKMQNQNVYNLRTVCMCLLAFAGFMRSAELLNIKHCDLLFFYSHMTVFIERSKTDVYRDGAWLIIGRTETKMCPVKCMECFLEKSGLKEATNSETYLFRNLSENKPMSYTRLRELFIEAFKPYVPDIKCYGLHSLRSGGATVAANRYIPDRMFKRHGRWRSKSAKDGSVKDSIENRLKVSLSLGL
ncbi:uncharacterized protein [Haliotis cracherodii]|uniref:uncharacterized protein n=1 Tax=Haliotis cracherodii TaxID=6455 RepID=UPI0039E96C91